MAVEIDMYIDQGSDYRHTFRYRELDGVTPAPLTGVSEIRAQVRKSLWEAAVLYEATTGNGGIVITDAAAGVFHLSVPASETSDWNIEEGVYDIELVDGASKPLRIVQGRIFLDREVTR